MTHLNPYMIELDLSHLNLPADYFIERELIRDDIFELNLHMNYFTDLALRRDKVMRELEETFQYHRKRWRQLWGGDDFYHPETIYIQPSYKPSYMKGLKGKPILVFLKEDGCLDIILDEQNWENCCELVRGDYIDYFYDYGFHPSNMCFHDEYEKEKKRNNAFLQNVLAQRDASNYLSVHENKRIINDASNHILSFF